MPKRRERRAVPDLSVGRVEVVSRQPAFCQQPPAPRATVPVLAAAVNRYDQPGQLRVGIETLTSVLAAVRALNQTPRDAIALMPSQGLDLLRRRLPRTSSGRP